MFNLILILLELSYYIIIFIYKQFFFFFFFFLNNNNNNNNNKRTKSNKSNNNNKKITIIIPSYNEEKDINNTLLNLFKDINIEVIISDGGSIDSTIKIVQKYCSKYQNIKLILGGKSRSECQNLGVKYATGDILLFLHADTILPDNYGDLIRTTIQKPDFVLGSFSFDVDDHSIWGINLVVELVRLRCKYFSLPYGDQALFLLRDTFYSLGKFRDIPLMEDLELVSLVRELFSPNSIHVLPEKVFTSSRRWKEKGVLSTTLINQIVLFGRLIGVPYEVLVKWYYGYNKKRNY